LDPVKPLEQLDVCFYSEVSFAEGLEVGEYSEAVGANVVRLESIFVQYLREKLGGRKRKATLNPSVTHDYVTWLRSRRGFIFEEVDIFLFKESLLEQDPELVWIRVGQGNQVPRRPSLLITFEAFFCSASWTFLDILFRPSCSTRYSP
jgi:hypothetical protein